MLGHFKPAAGPPASVLVIDPRIGPDPDVTPDSVELNNTTVNGVRDFGYEVDKAADNDASGNW